MFVAPVVDEFQRFTPYGAASPPKALGPRGFASLQATDFLTSGRHAVLVCGIGRLHAELLSDFSVPLEIAMSLTRYLPPGHQPYG
jgi:hypothetical protein